MDEEIVLPKWGKVVEAGPGQDAKRCTTCKRWLTTGVDGAHASFHNKRTTRDGLSDECRECKAYYQKTHWDQVRWHKRKHSIKIGRTIGLGSKQGCAERLEKFAASGEMPETEAERLARIKMEAFLSGSSVYDWQKES